MKFAKPIKNYKLRNKNVFISLLMVVVLFSCGEKKKATDSESLNSLFESVDREIENSKEYENDKERKIFLLKKQLGSLQEEESKSEICDLLIEEYESYKSDSALYYVNLNLRNPAVSSNEDKVIKLLIKKADITAHAGLFNEASQLLSAINPSRLDTALLRDYYSTYCDLYQYQSEYNTEGEYVSKTEKLRELYIDSVTMVSSPASLNYIINNAAAKTREGDTKGAEKMLLNKIKEYKSGDRNYSILASLLAYVYKTTGDTDNYRRYLILSVISDIKGSVKENMAIRALATVCYETGDFERADRYLRKSFEDANFFSARMRNAQSSRMLPIIGEAYNAQQKKLNHELSLLVIFISILALGFVFISVFALIQVRKVKSVNKKTNEMLKEVSDLSQKLSSVNKELSETNNDLQVSNKIKGEYAVLFMEYCSLAISALQHYQQSLKVAAAQGNLQTLVKKIESSNVESKMLAEFYSKFDEAFFNLYPNFIEKFNQLLNPDERITLNQKESLNTELRVFALIRMGIIDSDKIAKFLRCSITTVYTYRSKMKKRAKDPENFENILMKL